MEVRNHKDEIDLYFKHGNLSQSDLALLEVSPRLFYDRKIAGVTGPEKMSSGFKMGSMVDCYLFTPDEFKKRYVLQPDSIQPPTSANQIKFLAALRGGVDEVMAYKASYKTEKMKESVIESKAKTLKEELTPFIEFQESIGEREIYTEEEGSTFVGCAYGIMQNDKALSLLQMSMFGSDNYIALSQVPVYWKDEDGVPKKALIDRLVYEKNHGILHCIDLKTTGKPVTFFADAYERYRYFRQQAHYEEAAIEYLRELGHEVNTISSLIVAVQTIHPYTALVFEIERSYINKGKEELDSVIRRYQWHIASNEWDYPMEHYLNGGTLRLSNPNPS